MEKIKPITLEIEEKTWKDFKEITSRNTTLNEAIVNLIKENINNAKK